MLSLRNIFRKGFRTALTILGISVGVASVLLINTIGDVGKKTVNSELDSLGLNGIAVSANDKTSLDNNDIFTIKNIDEVSEVMPIITNSSLASKSDNALKVMIWGVDAGVSQVISIDIIHGSSFQKYDISAKENVCLIAENVSKKVFGRENAVGQEIDLMINGVYDSYKIIGITRTGSGILQNFVGDIIPDFCYVPYTTMQQSMKSDTLYQIAVKLKNDQNVETVSKTISSVLDASKGIKNSVRTSDLATQRMSLTGLLDTVTIILTIVGFISLLVAGLGIMTVMLVSVSERTKEIGIKKAIGASFRTIMSEFLIEALTICIIGSIIGCTIGIALAKIGGALYGITVGISLSSVITALLGAVATGVVFGLYPAFKGAKLQPVEALRYE